MIYNSLDEALTSIDKLGVYGINDLTSDYDINLIYSDDLPSNIAGISVPLTRTIFINREADAIEQVKYHEFVHCLVHSSFEPFYNSSYVVSTKTEYEANLGSFYLMIKNYLEVTNSYTSFDNFNIPQFMEACQIHSRFYYSVQQAAEKVFYGYVQN